jgi:hypothetical protein
MSQPNRFALTLETLAELTPEIQAARVDPGPALPNLSEVLDEFAPLPREALFLGLAVDGLPVLLNLLDPQPGPLLVAGDAGSGKTRLLRSIAQAVERGHRPQDVRVNVLSARPQEWASLDGAPHLESLASPRDPAAAGNLAALVERGHDKENAQEFRLLLIDDMHGMTHMGERALQHLRWLLLRGPARRIWPIVTLDSAHLEQLRPWLEAFRTRLFGHIESERIAQALAGQPGIAFQALMSGAQFAIREGAAWLNFWVPSLD